MNGGDQRGQHYPSRGVRPCSRSRCLESPGALVGAKQGHQQVPCLTAPLPRLTSLQERGPPSGQGGYGGGDRGEWAPPLKVCPLPAFLTRSPRSKATAAPL